MKMRMTEKTRRIGNQVSADCGNPNSAQHLRPLQQNGEIWRHEISTPPTMGSYASPLPLYSTLLCRTKLQKKHHLHEITRETHPPIPFVRHPIPSHLISSHPIPSQQIVLSVKYDHPLIKQIAHTFSSEHPSNHKTHPFDTWFRQLLRQRAHKTRFLPLIALCCPTCICHALVIELRTRKWLRD